VRCLSSTSVLYSIGKEDFIARIMGKNDKIKTSIKEEAKQKDEMIKDRVVQATLNKKEYA